MKEIPSFTGFKPETVRFLQELKENNYKQWFDEHKAVYQEVLLQPFRALAVMLSPSMYNIDPMFDLRPQKMLSRIYRDIRFSSNKAPYKTSMWLNFQRMTTHWENFPGYFAEFSDEYFMYGMGLFMPKRKVTDHLREEIGYNPESFKEMAQTALDTGFEVAGETYKRPLSNDLPEFYQPWMQRKNVYVLKTLPLTDQRLFNEAIALQLIEDFTQIADLYHFMVKIVQETVSPDH
ncbi:DUF2461 domain-containing protein [Proteiniphilum saccharofermentans]|uniref:DUF2461 domain-containing protein n=1 Tax=Proteiniphilum saccharofermentans TaxID=1642647 RepID=UPI0028ADA83F|nr:DUF2461 domain-containing protein [Proteiniphilum saccharofermentans]